MIRTKMFNQTFWTNSRRLFVAGCSFSGDLRHAFGTWCAMRGAPGWILEEWCGWADSETMKISFTTGPQASS
jgi:integrase